MIKEKKKQFTNGISYSFIESFSGAIAWISPARVLWPKTVKGKVFTPVRLGL